MRVSEGVPIAVRKLDFEYCWCSNWSFEVIIFGF